VERIEGERKRRDVVEFLVRWKGFEKCAWEPMCNLQNASLVIADWRARKSRRPY